MAKKTSEAAPPQDLGVTLEDIGPARKRMTIEVPAQRIAQAIESNYNKLDTDAVVPGFRKGHVPRKLLERRFGSTIREDTRNQLLGSCYSEAVEKQKLDVIGEPDIKDIEQIKLPDSGPLSFNVEIEVSPTVELPDLTGIEVKKPKLEVTDKDIDQEIDQLRYRLGVTKPVQDEAVKAKDYIKADVHLLAGEDAALNAEVLHHDHDAWVWVHGQDEEYKGHVAGIMVEKLGKQLIGKNAGDTVRISMTGPANHENEKIKDQPITVQIGINSIQRHEPAPLDQVVTGMGLESQEQLRDRVRQTLADRNQREQTAAMHQQVCDHLLEKIDLTLPEGLTSRQSARMLHREAIEMAYRGMDVQQIEQKIAEMRADSTERAAQQLKRFFILDKAAKQLAIEVSENEVNGQIAMIALQQGRRPEKLRHEMAQQGQIESLYLQIRDHKTLNKILETAKVTESDAPAAEPEAAPKKAKTTKKSTKKSGG